MENITAKKMLMITSYVFFAVVLSVSTYFLINNQGNSENYLFILSIVTLFQLILNLIYLKISRVGIFSMVGIFVIFLFVFSFGQVFLKGLIPAYEFKVVDISNRVEGSLYIKTIYYCFNIIFLFMLGVLFSSLNRKSLKKFNYHLKYINYCKPIGFLLLIISLPFTLYIDISNLIASFSNGYLSIYEKGYPGFFRTFSDLLLPAIILLLFGYKGKKNIPELIFLSAIIYKAGTMIAGQRGYAIIFIIVLFYIYVSAIKRFNVKNMIFIALGSIFLMNMLVVIKQIRGLTDKNFELIISSFVYGFQNNVILLFMEEFGATIYTPALSLYYYPDIIDYLNGSVYYLSFTTIFPNIGGILGNFITAFSWPATLASYVSGIGGSFIAELYVNFGGFSYLAAIISGLSVGIFSNVFINRLKSNDYLFVAIYSVLFSMILWWIRASFDFLIRSTFWPLAIIYFCYFILKQFGVKRLP